MTEAERALATVLFTDIVGSAERAASLYKLCHIVDIEGRGTTSRVTGGS